MYQQNNIEEISKIETIDCLIFIFSGHGNEDTIISNTGKQISIGKIHGAFNNDEFPILNAKPKMYLFDCCRGASTENTSTGKGQNDTKVNFNVNKDTVWKIKLNFITLRK